MKFCPHCGGDISSYLAAESTGQDRKTREPVAPVTGEYDQAKAWRKILVAAEAIKANPPAAEAIAIAASQQVRPLFKDGEPLSTIVHLVFDRDVTPQGGTLYQAIRTMGRTELTPERLDMMGYSVVQDGERSVARTVDDIPVGPAYEAIEYWGGEKQHHRWHLASPVIINPSRNGDPFFMDGNMVAFGACWKDPEKMDESLLELLGLFSDGLPGNREAIAMPLALHMSVQ